MIGLWVVLGTLAAAAAVGFALRAREGRIRTNRAHNGSEHKTSEHETTGHESSGHELPRPVTEALSADEPITLVQLSTTFCAPCRHARAVLGTLAESTAGLRHVELDVTNQPDVAHQLGVLRTPTTLALTPAGREVLRISGVPKTAGLRDALREHVPSL